MRKIITIVSLVLSMSFPFIPSIVPTNVAHASQSREVTVTFPTLDLAEQFAEALKENEAVDRVEIKWLENFDWEAKVIYK